MYDQFYFFLQGPMYRTKLYTSEKSEIQRPRIRQISIISTKLASDHPTWQQGKKGTMRYLYLVLNKRKQKKIVLEERD